MCRIIINVAHPYSLVPYRPDQSPMSWTCDNFTNIFALSYVILMS